MSETMLKDLAEFFEDKNSDMECHEYCAHSDAPYSRQAIRKEFKSYKNMLIKLKEFKAVKPKPKTVTKKSAKSKDEVK